MSDTKTPQDSSQNEENLDEILQEVENLKNAEAEEKKSQEISTVEKLESEISELKKQLEEKHEQFLRANADMQNVRRRADEARIKARYDGSVDAITPFLETVDLFEKALTNIPEDLKETPFVQGIISVEKKFSDSLKKVGIEFFGETGEDFDENKHDSMMLSSDAEKGKIAQVFEQGILFKGKTLRHAKVSVGG